MSATPAALRFDRTRAAQVGLLLAVAISLHVVPQWLAPWFDPALTMIALMTLDALVFAAVMRSPASWRTAAALAAIFLVELAVRRQHVAALPSVVLNLALAAVFGSTLARGRTPLVQAIAAHALGREALDAAFAQYLRRVT
ncbi:MAG: hypothetical protein N2483_11420, partial [Burkholderiaceae bacterium]|nr:hypothetical protein [Burkholderiaceae bacterium]